MTSGNKALKKRVRERMALTGETYTRTLKHLVGEKKATPDTSAGEPLRGDVWRHRTEGWDGVVTTPAEDHVVYRRVLTCTFLGHMPCEEQHLAAIEEVVPRKAWKRDWRLRTRASWARNKETT